MKLNEIKKTPKLGTYAGVRFDDTTADDLLKYIEDNNIPNSVKDFHSTLLFSRKHLPKYMPITYDKPLMGKPTEVTNLGDDKTIVIKFDAPELKKRHKKLMKEHGGTWDYDDFIPHVTLSYDAKRVDVSKLTTPKFSIKIVKEYLEPLEIDD